MRLVYWINKREESIHKGVMLDGVPDLFTNERDNRDQVKRKDREILGKGKDHVDWPADLLREGYKLCGNCFPNAALLLEPAGDERHGDQAAHHRADHHHPGPEGCQEAAQAQPEHPEED